MKIIAIGIIVSLICIGLGYAGKLLIDREYDSPTRTVVTYTEDENNLVLRATYPQYNSFDLVKFLNTWASAAASRSGNPGRWMFVKFKDGSSCRAHARGRKLEIIATRNDNDSTQVKTIKANYKVINDFIIKEARTKQ